MYDVNSTSLEKFYITAGIVKYHPVTSPQDISANLLKYTATQLPLEKSYMFRISQVSKGGESYPSDPTSPVYLAKTGTNQTLPDIVILYFRK